MDFQGIYDRLKSLDAPGLEGFDLTRPVDKKAKDKGRSGNPYIKVDAQRLAEFLVVARDDEQLDFDVLVDITASDPAADAEELWILCELLSIKNKQRVSLKGMLPKSNLRMPTSSLVHRAANWHERECAEMYGITFVGHPDPRHILLPDDWKGFPMRKDYEFPTEYHGISCE